MKHLLTLATLLFALTAGAATLPDDRVVTLEAGVHKLLRQPGPVGRVAVGDPAIAEVTVINRREVLITGKKNGVTSLLVWPKAGTSDAPAEYRLRVGPAVDPLKAKNSDPDLGKARIDAQDGLSGNVPSLLAHRRAKLDAQSQAQAAAGGAAAAPKITDRSEVDLETQVMTEVKIVEVSRSTLHQFGFNVFRSSRSTGAGIFSPGSLAGISVNADEERTEGIRFEYTNPVQSAFQLAVGDPTKAILGTLSVLSGKGLARVLAEPSLLATSGQTASYLAGGEFPVPIAQGTGGITVQYKEFGVRLTLSPTVLSRNRISLKAAPEVSELDFSAGIQIGGVAVPALTVRRTDTTVELGDGESFVISGLVSDSMRNSVSKVPGLGDLPVLGAFFRSTNLQKSEKELIMVVTPRLVRPLAREARLPPLPGAKYDKYDPNFAETFLLETGDFDTGFSK